jgi:sugar lactone lactonase YvrE
MSDQLRDRLGRLADEMPPLSATPDLPRRVRRRQVATAAAAMLLAGAVVAATVVGIRAVGRNDVTPGAEPFPRAHDPIPAAQAILQAPEDVFVDASGNVFISEWYGNRVDEVAPGGALSVIAGTGVAGFDAGSQQAVDAMMNKAAGLALDQEGNLLVVDNDNDCVRRVVRTGDISTVAGMCGTSGNAGDGGPATDAQLSRPVGIAADPAGGFYFTDNDYGLVQHVVANGTITTVIGAGRRSPFELGKGVPGSQVHLARTGYVLLDPDGNLYVTDMRLNIVVKVDTRGIATLIAGTGEAGSTGDGGPATQAELDFPSGLAMDTQGNLYITETNGNVIREVDTHGVIHTFAGTGVEGFGGDGGPAVDARLSGPSGLAVGPDGSLYIADQGNDVVRRVDPTGVITRIAGQ